MYALSTYINFIDHDGNAMNLRFQNFFPDETRAYEGKTYQPAGFGYTGAAVDLNAANVEASLVFLVSDLILSFAQQAADDEWLVEVQTVWLDPDTLQETSDRLEEVYGVTGWSHNQRELVMRLGSPLDAQAAELPARVLSQKMVGNLPARGSISFV